MSKLIKQFLYVVVMVFGVTQLANATPLNLSVHYPDVGGAVDTTYDYTAATAATPASGTGKNCNLTTGQGCKNYVPATSGSPGGGTLSIVGNNNFFAATYTDTESGSPTIGSTAWATLSLTANYDEFGAFTDGTFSIVMDNDTIYDSTGAVVATGYETLGTGTLDTFGFFGSDDVGFLEFEYTMTGGNWLTNLGYTGGGVIAGVDMESGAPAGTWDNSVMTQSWSATAAGNNINIYAPIPAAVWLFGSGLVALFSLARVKRS